MTKQQCEAALRLARAGLSEYLNQRQACALAKTKTGAYYELEREELLREWNGETQKENQ